MASFLTDLAKPYVEKLINWTIAESSYICCFTCIAKDFEEERGRLETESATFDRRIEEAKRRGEDVLPNALGWKGEVDELIQEDTKKRQKCFFEFCPHCLWRYSRGKFLANKKERIKELIVTGKELTIGLPAHLPDIERYTTQHYVHLKSRESQYIKLLDELKDDNNYMIGLHGMGGTGKTTLIKKVGKELKKSGKFTHVIVTTVSFSPYIQKIQDDIAGPLGLKFDDCNDSDRPGKLWKRLTNGEKILLILDDVWGDIDFNEIGIPCSDNHKGCKIIVTTRNQSVCNKLGCNKTIQLDLLSKEDAWIMFKKYADLSETSTKYFLDKGRKISNECKNLPIAIAVIASSLKGKQHQEEWDMALKFLKKDISRHNDDNDVLEIYKCLKFSYDKLNEDAKSLFLLCSVFREDEDIDIEILARLAIGGGIFKEDYDNYEEARSRVFISKNKLLDSCLLLQAGQMSVKMHDFARDAAQWIANNEIQTRKVYDKNQKEMLEKERNIKYLLCEGKPNQMFSCMIDGSKVEILIFIINVARVSDVRKIEFPDSFFENITNLRVFYLHGVYGLSDTIPLPQSMQKLNNIRSLIFAYCVLGDISIFGNLQSLGELELNRCKFFEIPNGITELKKFRLLKLKFCSIIGNNPFEVIKRCSSLQELYFIFGYPSMYEEITFPKLQRFHVSYRETNSSISKYVSIERKDKFFQSETLKYCMQEAEVLRLGRIEGEWRNIIPDIVHMDQGMNDIVELSLRFISQLKFLVYTEHPHSQVSNVFSKLVILHLGGMENLEELCNGSLSFDSFKSLESLTIQDCKHLRSLSGIANQCNLKSVSLERCPMLISLFEVETSGSLVLLELLRVTDCENLQDLITHERKGEGSKREVYDSSSSKPMFMKLKDLIIMNCPKFEIILPLISSHDLPALKSITVESCNKLNYIFGQYVELGSLEDMDLGRVPNLIDIFPECNRTTSFSINRSSPVSTSASKPTTHPNPIKCSILTWSDMFCCGKKYENKLMESNSNTWEHVRCLSRQSNLLCNVKKIVLTDLREIKSVFVLSIGTRMLLEVLKISGCDELEHIIDMGDHENTGGNNYIDVFPKLKELYIDHCVKLKYIFGHYNDDHQNRTDNHLNLPSLEFVLLSDLPSLVAICPEQYHTKFPVMNGLGIKYCVEAPIIKSIGHFIRHQSISRSVNCTDTKKLSGSMEDFHALEKVELTYYKIESIFCVNNEVNEQQVNLGLQNIKLENLYVMVCPFVGPKNYFSLLNLKKIEITACEKLQIVFSASILRFLPQLDELTINECEELKHIIEDDLENQNMSNFSSTKTCFPKLKVLVVQKCNKLKYVFPVSICNELPELKVLIITEAKELEEIFKSSEGEGTEIVRIPNLKLVVTLGLPRLFQTQGIQFQRAEHRFINDCDKISLTSTSREFKPKFVDGICHDIPGFKRSENLDSLVRNLPRYITPKIKIKQIQEVNHELVENVVGLGTPSLPILPTNSEALINEQSVDQQCPLEETDATANAKTTTQSTHLESVLINEQSTTQQESLGESQTEIKPSHENNGSTSEKLAATILSTTSGTKNESPIQKSKQDISVEGGTASTNVKKTLISSTSQHEKPSHGIEISVEQGTTSTNSKPTTSSSPIVAFEHISSSQAPMNEITMDQQSPLEETEAAVTPSQLEGSISEKVVETKNVSLIQLVAPKEKELINEQSTTQQQSLGESHATIEPSQGNNGSTSEKIGAATLSTISDTKNESLIQLVSHKQKDIKTSVEGGTASSNAKALTSSTSKREEPSHVMEIIVEQGTTSTSSREITSSGPIVTSQHNSASEEYGNDQPAIQSFSISTKEALAKEVVDLGGSQEINPIKSLGDTSQILEDLGSSLVVRRELEQLVSEKHLNHETLSLLTDFLVKHPRVLLVDASLTNKFKGYAYSCLVDLLRFLRSHSVLDVLGSSHSEFVNLVQVVRNFHFNKDWLDGVERRALFPELHFSQDAIQKLMDSKKQVTKEIEEMRLKMYFFNQHVEDIKHQLSSSEAVLASIIQQEEQVIKTTAALSVPLDY